MMRALVTSVLLACAGLAGAAEPMAAPAGPDARVTAAIERCVMARMGHDAKVIVRDPKIFSSHPLPAGDLQAVAMAGARLGGPVQFALLAPVGRGEARRFVEVGRVVAETDVDVRHLRAARVITGGEPIGADAVVEVDGEVEDVAIERLPRLADVAGSRAARSIADGALIPPSALRLRVAVRSGQRVRAIVRVGDAEASATLVAEQSGAPGALVRVVNPGTGKILRARVVGEGVVEVVND